MRRFKIKGSLQNMSAEEWLIDKIFDNLLMRFLIALITGALFTWFMHDVFLGAFIMEILTFAIVFFTFLSLISSKETMRKSRKERDGKSGITKTL